jgi:hypothetical protein
MSAPAANRRTEIIHPAAFTARILFFTSAALALIASLQFAVTDRNLPVPLLSVLDVIVIIGGLVGMIFGYRHMGKFTIPMESPMEFADVGNVRRALELQSISGKDNIIIRRFGLGHFLLTMLSDAQLVSMSRHIQGIAIRSAKTGSKIIVVTTLLIVLAVLAPEAGIGLSILIVGVAWSAFYVWVMIYLRSWSGRMTTRDMASSMVEGAGHPQTLFQLLENRARNLQASLGPVRMFAKQPLLTPTGVQDTGNFDSFVLYEEPPEVTTGGAQTQFGTVVAPVAAIGLITGFWILHEVLSGWLATAADGIPGPLDPNVMLVLLFGLLLSGVALRLAWKLDSTFRFTSNMILIVLDGIYSQSRVRIGRSIVDSNESENLATRADIRINLFAGEALSETPHILKPRELSGLTAGARPSQLIELFRSDVDAFSLKGVAPIGIKFQGAGGDITSANLAISAARAGMEAPAIAASTGQSLPRLAGPQPALTAATVPELPAADTKVETKDCPMCAETVKAAARKCKHCGFMFE